MRQHSCTTRGATLIAEVSKTLHDYNAPTLDVSIQREPTYITSPGIYTVIHPPQAGIVHCVLWLHACICHKQGKNQQAVNNNQTPSGLERHEIIISADNRPLNHCDVIVIGFLH